MNDAWLQLIVELFFLSIVFLHLTKKNLFAVVSYGIQSFAIVLILLHSFLETGSLLWLLITVVVLIVKVILAPIFFVRLIRKHALKFSASTYLTLPLTLIFIALLATIAYAPILSPLTSIVPSHHTLLSLALASMFLSLFVIINRKGALSQIIGILSLENSIVVFATFAGLEQSPGLQAGILFDIAVWVIIATVFIAMLYKHFGTLNVTAMKHLTD